MNFYPLFLPEICSVRCSYSLLFHFFYLQNWQQKTPKVPDVLLPTEAMSFQEDDILTYMISFPLYHRLDKHFHTISSYVIPKKKETVRVSTF